MRRLKITRPSLFTKLLLLLFFTWLFTNILLAILFRQIIHPQGPPIHRAVIGYMDYLVNDLGHPPSFEKALDISRQAGIELKYESSDYNWVTEPKIFSHIKHFNRIKEGDRELETRFSQGRLYVSLKTDHGRITLATRMRSLAHNVEKKLFFSSLLLLLFILTVVYLIIRWIMKPVKLLSKGAEEIAIGNLEHRINIQRSDELGDLVNTFNAMTDRIQDQIKSKEQLLLNVSHELRSPITRIKVALELMPDSEKRKELNDDLIEMEAMVTELLESARLGKNGKSQKREPINLNELFAELKQIYQSQPGLTVRLEHGENTFLGDVRQIKTVFTNILNNSFKYSHEEARPVDIETKTENRTIFIQIKDYGPGIPRQDLPFIFEPFYRVDKSRSKKTGGYGLGLSLCKKIVEAHKGEISIDSEQGKGTTVTLSFPVSLMEEKQAGRQNRDT